MFCVRCVCVCVCVCVCDMLTSLIECIFSKLPSKSSGRDSLYFQNNMYKLITQSRMEVIIYMIG
jgi:hypothetical protein